MNTNEETILLVEDDVFLRKCLSIILESEGYKVIEAEDGQHALDTYKSGMEPVSLVLMDIKMPNKDGISAYEDILSLNSRENIILMSGSPLEFFSSSDKIHFINKPMMPQTLISYIRGVLDGSAAHT